MLQANLPTVYLFNNCILCVRSNRIESKMRTTMSNKFLVGASACAGCAGCLRSNESQASYLIQLLYSFRQPLQIIVTNLSLSNIFYWENEWKGTRVKEAALHLFIHIFSYKKITLLHLHRSGSNPMWGFDLLGNFYNCSIPISRRPGKAFVCDSFPTSALATTIMLSAPSAEIFGPSPSHASARMYVYAWRLAKRT